MDLTYGCRFDDNDVLAQESSKNPRGIICTAAGAAFRRRFGAQGYCAHPSSAGTNQGQVKLSGYNCKAFENHSVTDRIPFSSKKCRKSVKDCFVHPFSVVVPSSEQA